MNQRFGAVQTYLAKTQKALARGDATEHTYRAFLQELVQSLARGISCINEPKGSKAGHPDLMVALGETPLGFIETKDIGLDLAEIAESGQLKRYRRSLPNLILTDYLDFRWFRNGSEMFSARLAFPTAKDRLRRTDDGEARLLTLFDNFLAADVKTIGSPKELAARMAKLAQLVRRKIVEAFEAEAAGDELHSQLKAFREVLLPDLDITKFADMYAQTICYGLFAGKCNTAPGQAFCRDNAASFLPRTNPFLRKLFSSIMAGDLNDKVAGTIDAITFLLDHADIQAILADFGKRTRKEDPVVHFYETFLAEYDPKLRKSRGVYYTPEPVVSYIVRSVDWLLKEKFGKKEGLADPSVLVLDPACGTGTFLYHVIRLIEERVKAKGQYGQWNTYVRDSLLPRIFGFELLMAPYAVAHLKLGLLLQETGYDFSSDERLGIYLTNTLEEAAKKSDILFAQWISDEANAAAEVKREKPIVVVLGNPPYSKASFNQGPWIERAMARYKKTVRGEEVQIQALSDDYIKFICFAHDRIERTGFGVLAFITNNGFLDGTLLRDMRHELLTTFPELYLLNLFGDSRKIRGGRLDENVFDIQQGVAISLLVRPPETGDHSTTSYQALRGSRADKYSRLASSSVELDSWVVLKPEEPYYRFIPVKSTGSAEWQSSVALSDLFRGETRTGRRLPFFGAGFTTRHDDFAVAFTSAELLSNIERFIDPAATEEELRREFHLCTTQHWSFKEARKTLTVNTARQHLRRFLYRPFDWRYTVYSPLVIGEMRPEIMQQLDGVENVALLTTRRTTGRPFDNFLAASGLAEYKSASHDRNTQVFPLYLYTESSEEHLFSQTEREGPAGKCRPNLNPKSVAEMEKKLGLTFVPEQPEAASGKPSADSPFGPEDVFDYIYAVFHSPTYRKRYAEFLKIDFPRVPLTSNRKLFWKLVSLGRELVALHLLESPKVNDFVTEYPVKGSDTVEKVWYVEPGPEAVSRKPSAVSACGSVHINFDQYFSGVRPEEWEFHIGGYQVLQKWLKDRKGRKLSNDDIRHYQRVVVAIRETMRLMAEVDKAIPKWPIA